MGWIQRMQEAWKKRRQAGKGEALGLSPVEQAGGGVENTVGPAPGALMFLEPEALWQGLGWRAEEPGGPAFSFEEELERQALRYGRDMEELW